MNMLKEKIKSLSNTKKVWWIRVSSTTQSLEYIDKIIKNFEEVKIGLDYYSEKGEDKKLKIEEWYDIDWKVEVTGEEVAYIIVTKSHINIILRKDCKKFEKLKEEFEKHFEFKKEK